MLPDWRELHAAMLGIQLNEKPSQEVRYRLIEHGLISEEKQMQNCRTCGSPRVDFHYDKITPGGRLFMGMAAALVEKAK